VRSENACFFLSFLHRAHLALRDRARSPADAVQLPAGGGRALRELVAVRWAFSLMDDCSPSGALFFERTAGEDDLSHGQGCGHRTIDAAEKRDRGAACAGPGDADAAASKGPRHAVSGQCCGHHAVAPPVARARIAGGMKVQRACMSSSRPATVLRPFRLSAPGRRLLEASHAKRPVHGIRKPRSPWTAYFAQEQCWRPLFCTGFHQRSKSHEMVCRDFRRSFGGADRTAMMVKWHDPSRFP
jgi:hypothetical protein